MAACHHDPTCKTFNSAPSMRRRLNGIDLNSERRGLDASSGKWSGQVHYNNTGYYGGKIVLIPGKIEMMV